MPISPSRPQRSRPRPPSPAGAPSKPLPAGVPVSGLIMSFGFPGFRSDDAGRGRVLPVVCEHCGTDSHLIIRSVTDPPEHETGVVIVAYTRARCGRFSEHPAGGLGPFPGHGPRHPEGKDPHFRLALHALRTNHEENRFRTPPALRTSGHGSRRAVARCLHPDPHPDLLVRVPAGTARITPTPWPMNAVRMHSGRRCHLAGLVLFLPRPAPRDLKLQRKIQERPDEHNHREDAHAGKSGRPGVPIINSFPMSYRRSKSVRILHRAPHRRQLAGLEGQPGSQGRHD